jgi:nickel-dependent lactate racemase
MSSSIVSNLLSDIHLPKMIKVRQSFPRPRIEDIPLAVRNELNKPEIAMTIKAGKKIAITVGSRGVANIAIITKEVVTAVKKLGGEPFIIPAMGSHGGATAEGQLEVLESFGVTEEFIGAPIKSSMEVVRIGETSSGKPVHIDKYAAEADGIIVMGRVKPHTSFRGKYESGLMKMMTIGLGKQKGADTCHSEGFKNMAYNVPLYANVILEKANILFGIAIVENPFDETSKIVALTKKDIPEREPELLSEAKGLMPRIMFDSFDVLVVDEIGKNISGDGMDPNITATYSSPYASGGPNIQRVVILDLTEESHGNANGMGTADFTTKRFFDKTNLTITYPNAITSRIIETAKVPVILKNDYEAIAAGIKTCIETDYDNAKVVRIKNTLHLEEIYISEALLNEAVNNPAIEILEEPKYLEFDEEGYLFD